MRSVTLLQGVNETIVSGDGDIARIVPIAIINLSLFTNTAAKLQKLPDIYKSAPLMPKISRNFWGAVQQCIKGDETKSPPELLFTDNRRAKLNLIQYKVIKTVQSYEDFFNCPNYCHNGSSDVRCGRTYKGGALSLLLILQLPGVKHR